MASVFRYGWLLYRTSISSGGNLTVMGYVKDIANILLEGNSSIGNRQFMIPILDITILSGNLLGDAYTCTLLILFCVGLCTATSTLFTEIKLHLISPFPQVPVGH